MGWKIETSRSRQGFGTQKLCQEDEVRLSIVRTGQKDGIAVTIGADVMRSMRWMTGDRICIVSDGDNWGIMRNDEGFVLGQSSGPRTNARPSSVRAVARMPMQQSAVDALDLSRDSAFLCKPRKDDLVLVLK